MVVRASPPGSRTTISMRPDSLDSIASQRPSGENAGDPSSNGPEASGWTAPSGGRIAIAVCPPLAIVVTARRPSGPLDAGTRCVAAFAGTAVIVRSSSRRTAIVNGPDVRVAKNNRVLSCDHAGETLMPPYVIRISGPDGRSAIQISEPLPSTMTPAARRLSGEIAIEVRRASGPASTPSDHVARPSAGVATAASVPPPIAKSVMLPPVLPIAVSTESAPLVNFSVRVSKVAAWRSKPVESSR
jgi:hypothetical protein